MNILGNSGIESNADGMWPGAKYKMEETETMGPDIQTGEEVEEADKEQVPTILEEERISRLGSNLDKASTVRPGWWW